MGIIAKIKALWAARKVVNQMGDIKRGWKTWGFWVTLLGNVGALVVAIKGVIPATLALIIMTSVTGLYTVVRGWQKIDEENVKPIYQTTEFWMTLGAEASKAFVALQQGGVNPAWMATASALLAALLGVARDLAHKESK